MTNLSVTSPLWSVFFKTLIMRKKLRFRKRKLRFRERFLYDWHDADYSIENRIVLLSFWLIFSRDDWSIFIATLHPKKKEVIAETPNSISDLDYDQIHFTSVDDINTHYFYVHRLGPPILVVFEDTRNEGPDNHKMNAHTVSFVSGTSQRNAVASKWVVHRERRRSDTTLSYHWRTLR